MSLKIPEYQWIGCILLRQRLIYKRNHCHYMDMQSHIRITVNIYLKKKYKKWNMKRILLPLSFTSFHWLTCFVVAQFVSPSFDNEASLVPLLYLPIRITYRKESIIGIPSLLQLLNKSTNLTQCVLHYVYRIEFESKQRIFFKTSWNNLKTIASTKGRCALGWNDFRHLHCRAVHQHMVKLSTFCLANLALT